MDITIENIAEKLANVFPGGAVYKTKLIDKYKGDKQLSETFAVKREKTTQDYYDHLTTEYGLTVAPIFDSEWVFFGALDIDKYQLTEEETKRLIGGASARNMLVCRTKSGGLHLYCFASEKIPARLMRRRLMSARDELGLSPKTEIFPKQDRLDEKTPRGNAITIAYRGCFTKDFNQNCVCLDIRDGLIIELRIGEFLTKAEKYIENKYTNNFNYFKKWEEYEDPVSHSENISKEEGKMGLKQILKAIKEKQEHSQGGTYDNWITLYIAKAIKSFKTDEEITEKLDEVEDYKNTPYTEGFGKAMAKKIEACRKKFEITCPSILKQKIRDKIVYIADEDRYYDIEKGKTYKEEVLNNIYRREFQKPLLTTWLLTDPDRLVVEHKVWSPKNYNKETPVFDKDGYKYLNTYAPNKLEAVKGDTKPWHDMLNFVFSTKKGKNEFLDWLAFQIQKPGIKIRFANILASKNFQIGKGSLWRVIVDCFGEHNTKTIDVDEALDHSKNYLQTSAIVLIDEMESKGNWGEKKSLLNKMKRIITESVFSNRRRYHDYDEKGIESCTNILFFTNNLDALSIPKNEKRYVVYWNENERLKQEVYDKFHKWVDEGGSKAVLYELQNRDIEHFNPNSVAPESTHTKQMIEAGAHPLAQLLKANLDMREAPLISDIVSTLNVYDFLNENRQLNRANLNKVAECLEFIGGIKREQVPVHMRWNFSENSLNNPPKRTARTNLYIIRNHEKYINLENRELGMAFEMRKHFNVDLEENFEEDQGKGVYIQYDKAKRKYENEQRSKMNPPDKERDEENTMDKYR